ncbi:MAG: threonine/homoserine/homoserine lactone efflux protein, partial [Sphingobacteriales bacterium]
PFVQSLTLAGIHFLIAMVWQCSLSGAINSAKNWLKNTSIMTWMEGITGTVLILLGIKLLMDDSVV